MKKVFVILAVIATVFAIANPFMSVDAASKKKKKTTTTTEATVREPINMYVFYAGYCQYCKALHSYLDDELTKDADYKDKFNVIYIEIADDEGKALEGNQKMYSTVTSNFNYTEGSIPFYVIGDEYLVGYSESMQDTIKELIDKAYKSKKYEDVVSKLIDINAIETVSNDSKEDTKDNNMVGYIVLGIVAILIIAIIFGRSKSTYYVEER